MAFYFGGTATSVGEKRPPPTAGRIPGASKHRRTGNYPSWTSDFPWLVISNNDCGEQGMLCRLTVARLTVDRYEHRLARLYGLSVKEASPHWVELKPICAID